MEALTIHEAAATTGWSPRMLRYVERRAWSPRPARPPATASTGRRAAAAAHAQGAARPLDLGLSDVAFAARLADDPELRARRAALARVEAARPEDVDAGRLAALRAGQAPAAAGRRLA